MPGLAMAQATFPPSSIIIVEPDGKMMMHVDKKAWDAGMQHSKQVTGPVMLMSSGGKLYLVPGMSAKMPNGGSMVDYFARQYSNPGV
jgi:hypothetical protein